MLFASTELAARVERAEVRMLDDCAVAVAARRPDEAVLRCSISGGLATFTGAGSPLNKLAGLGFEALDETLLAEIEGEFARRGTPLQAEVSTLGDPTVVTQLCRRGYLLTGFENVLGRSLSREERFPGAPDIAISRSGDDLALWLDVVVTGFAAPDRQGVASHETFPRDVLERAIGDMTAADGFERWLAHRANEPAGAASLRLSEGVAQLCGAASLPAHRRRGVQTALLHARLAHAAAQGCDLAVITTQPGSKSMQNAQRQGFGLLYARAVLVRGG